MTAQDSPALIKRIYQGLESARVGNVMWRPRWRGPMLLTLSDGRTMRLDYCSDPRAGEHWAYIADKYLSDDLWEPLQELEKDAKAASLDSRIGDFSVNLLEIKLRHSDPHWPPVDSKEGQALIAKCKDIIDCLDPRVAWR